MKINNLFVKLTAYILNNKKWLLIIIGFYFFASHVSLVLAGPKDVIGNITLPEPLSPSNGGYGGLFNQKGGLIGFASNLIKLLMIAAGIWSFINILLAGFAYVTSNGNPEHIAKANSQIYMSLIGLAVMVASFALAAIAGWILFGNPGAILSPTIYGPGAMQGLP